MFSWSKTQRLELQDWFNDDANSLQMELPQSERFYSSHLGVATLAPINFDQKHPKAYGKAKHKRFKTFLLAHVVVAKF